MQKAKVALLVLLLFVLVRNAGPYHRATQFNRYVKEQASAIGTKGPLKEMLLLKAQENQLSISDENINVTTMGPELRVSVEYQVPLDLILFQKALTFHPTGVHID